MATSRVLTSRRTAISVVLAAPLTLAACELDPRTDPGAASPDSDDARDPVPDAELLSGARSAISATMASVQAAIAAHRRLRPALSPWLSLHVAHLDVLDDGTEVATTEALPPTGPATVVSQSVLRLEAHLADTLARAARQAISGDLARALASMSAALRQQAAT